jgi:HTH-type transcriptional regulator, competence development regulator
MTLASLLKDARSRQKLSLRAVERRTGISNGYLSLLEKGTARKPSPEFLEKLATLYGASYELLMELAGYRAPQPSPIARAIPGIDEADDLSAIEMEQLRAFVGYLRSSRTTPAQIPSSDDMERKE